MRSYDAPVCPQMHLEDEILQAVDTGERDEAMGFLRGDWSGGHKAMKETLERDHKQVHDTSRNR